MSAALRMAGKAVRHSAYTNLFSAIALAAVLAPLLVLYGLKLGIIGGLLEKLRSDPAILRIAIAGHRTLSEADLATIRAWPDTGFVAGAPRSIVAAAEMRASEAARDVVSADWLPTGAGDPLLPAATRFGDDEIALSQALAEKLDARIGGTVYGSIYRNGQSETLDMPMQVVAIIPRAELNGDKALVSEARLAAMARFADGVDNGQPSAAPRTYDSLRLYARALDAVEPLERRIAKFGFRTSSAAENIAWVQGLDRVMTGVFAIVSAAGVLGYAISLWAMITATVSHARPHLALLRLIGMSRRSLLTFPLVQAFAITSLGIAMALVFAYAAAQALNSFYPLAGTTGDICRLEGWLLAWVIAASYGLALLVAVMQIRKLQKIAPSEALAESLA
ncbi:ABC transporter permease [Xanthobacteraceae bacterium A53D]